MMKKINDKVQIILFVILTVVCFIASMCIGRYKVNIFGAVTELIKYLTGDTVKLSTEANVLLNIRLPRTLSAILVGGSLSLAGSTYQSVFRNRLASPDLLGVSTGSCVGAAICIICGLGALQIQIGAFTCGLLTVILTYIISRLFKREKGFALILSGVLVGGVMTSLLGLIKYLANPETQLPTIVYWTMGSISNISLEQLKYVVGPMAISMIILCLTGWRTAFFAINEDVAKSSGENITRQKGICVVFATLLTACAVSVAGTISWVGLAMPQAVRLLCGGRTKQAVCISVFAGMIFLLVADIFGRLISAAEIPMSILTGVPGVVIFIACVYLSNRKERHGI